MQHLARVLDKKGRGETDKNDSLLHRIPTLSKGVQLKEKIYILFAILHFPEQAAPSEEGGGGQGKKKKKRTLVHQLLLFLRHYFFVLLIF